MKMSLVSISLGFIGAGGGVELRGKHLEIFGLLQLFGGKADAEFKTVRFRQIFCRGNIICGSFPADISQRNGTGQDKNGTLSPESVMGILSEEKKPLHESVTISHDTLMRYFPKSYTTKQMEKVILKLLDNWLRRREQSQER